MFEQMRKLNGRRPRSLRFELERERERLSRTGMAGMSALLADWIKPELLQPTQRGDGSRQRVFDLATTFQAFLWQELQGQAPCRDAVREVQAVRLASGQVLPGSATSAFCQARARLPIARLDEIDQALEQRMTSMTRSEDLWLGREVKVMDGTGIRVEDTVANAKEYGYPGGQKPGCGFPVLKLAGLFSLSSGGWLSHAVGTSRTHDMALSAALLNGYCEEGDVILGDRGYCAYWLMALLLNRGADAVLRLHQARSRDLRLGERLGPEDRLQVWRKPQRPPQCTLSKEEYDALPDELSVRIVRLRLERRGQRTREVVLATTLVDPMSVSRSALGELYLRRWQVELNFDDIKTTLGMEHLACKSPAMIQRALRVFACAYNLIRGLMLEAAVRCGVQLWRLSFKGSAGALTAWLGGVRGHTSRRRAQSLWEALLEIVAEDLIPHRPDRHEPRVVKRRPKSYQLLTKPRHQMKTSPHRN